MDNENMNVTRGLRDVLSTLAIEDMYLKKDFVRELVMIENGEKTSEQLRQEVIRKYTR